MPRTCTICQHPKRADIDKALVDGEPYRSIAKRFDTSDQAMYRHKAEHIPEHLAHAEAAKEVASATTLLEHVRLSHARLEQMLFTAEMMVVHAQQTNDRRGVLEAIRTVTTVHRELRGYFDLLGELEGELSRQPVVNVHLSPEWQRIRVVLLQALQPYPDARSAVSQALLEVERA
jgi:hypothetical protein